MDDSQKIKWEHIKQSVITEAAIICIDLMFAVFPRLDKAITEDYAYYKITTPTHRVRLLADDLRRDKIIISKPKGWLKVWTAMNNKSVPYIFADEIFDKKCTSQRRQKLVTKMIGLKAFW